jgi:hypothetical protein
MVEKILEFVKEHFFKKDTTVEAICYTELEEFKFESWPRKFPVFPKVNDRIVSKSGKSLSVVAVEFSTINERGFSSTRLDDKDIARVRLELG